MTMRQEDRRRLMKLRKWLKSLLQRDTNLATQLGRVLNSEEALLPDAPFPARVAAQNLLSFCNAQLDPSLTVFWQ